MSISVKKRVALILIAAVLFVFTPLTGVSSFAAQSASGKAGENVKWVIKNDEIIFSGSGAIDNYNTQPPWYSYATDINKITIGKGITKIGDRAFWGLRYVSEVSLPSSLKTIGLGSFYGLSLEKITLPSGLKTIGESAFEENYNLTSVVLPKSLETIGKAAFFDTGLSSVTIPASVKTIGSMAFAGFTSGGDKLEAINVDSANKNFSSQDGVLFNKKKTKLVEFPQKKTGSYKIPSTVTTIGAYAFRGAAISSVTIPNSVKKIGEGAFSGCLNISTINIPDSVTTLGNEAFSASAITEITVPGSIREVSDTAFALCGELENIVLSPGVGSIGYCAFNLCSKLKTITIPASVTSISNKIWWDDSTKTTPTIIGYSNTRAESWAKDNGWEFQSLGNHNHTLAHHKTSNREYDKCTDCGAILNEKIVTSQKPAKTSITSIKAEKYGFTVKWEKKKVTGYQIGYSAKSSMTNRRIETVSKASAVSKRINGIASKSKLYVQVRTYKLIDGKKVYSAWSAKKTVTTK